MTHTPCYRILIGFSEISGYQSNLFLGFNLIGQDVGYINNQSFEYNYGYDESKNNLILNWYIKLCKILRKNFTFFNKIIFSLLSFVILIYIIYRYDIFIISGSLILFGLDLNLLRLFKKKIIYVSLGSDSRPPYLNGKYKDEKKINEFSLKTILYETKILSNKVQKIENKVDLFINYPQHAHFLQKKFINGLKIGFPINTGIQLFNSSVNNDTNQIRVLHAPSRPRAKGTYIIRKIINELSKENINIDYIEMVNQPNKKVIEEIKKADIILDQVYSDIPLAGLGCEASIYSKPVISGGYYCEYIRNDTDLIDIPPSIFVHPKELKNTLKNFCLNKEKRLETGRRLNEFVRKNWDCRKVAQKYLKLINNRYDEALLYDPSSITYFGGWGLSEDELKSNLNSVYKSEHSLKNFFIPSTIVLNKLKKKLNQN